MVFNEHLICRRKQLGLSQEQLGEKIGVTRQTVSKWELGETTPEMDKLIQLSQLFNVSIDELVGNVECSGNGNDGLCLAGIGNHGGTYEYKSKKTFHGIPLVHVNVGFGLKKAKGIIAIGNVATGVVSLGLVSTGVVSLGVLSAGLIGIGTIAVGLLMAFGGISVGTVAFGGIAVGVLSIGGLSIGIYSLGGCAIGEKIAKGGYADAIIAIGDETNGEITFDINVKGQEEAIRQAIITRFPKIWKFLVRLFS